MQQLAKWKPSSIGWRCYQFFDTLLYCLSWPFLLVSWAGFLGVCLIDCGVIQLPNFVNFVGMCLKFTYFGSAAFVVAILFQVTVPFAFWHAFVDYHIMIAKYRRDDRGMFAMASTVKQLIYLLLPCVVLRGVYFLVSNVVLMTMPSMTILAFLQTAAFLLCKLGCLALICAGVGFLAIRVGVILADVMNESREPDPATLIYSKRQLSGVISSEALKENKGVVAGKHKDFCREAKKLYHSNYSERVCYVLTSVVDTLFSVVSQQPPNENCLPPSEVSEFKEAIEASINHV